MTDPPPMLSPNSILPPPSSHFAFILTGENCGAIFKNVNVQIFFGIFFTKCVNENPVRREVCNLCPENLFSSHSDGHILYNSRIHSFTVHRIARLKKTTTNLSLVGIPPQFRAHYIPNKSRECCSLNQTARNSNRCKTNSSCIFRMY